MMVAFFGNSQSYNRSVAIRELVKPGLRILRRYHDIQNAAHDAGLLAVKPILDGRVQTILRCEAIALIGSLQAYTDNAPIAFLLG